METTANMMASTAMMMGNWSTDVGNWTDMVDGMMNATMTSLMMQTTASPIMAASGTSVKQGEPIKVDFQVVLPCVFGTLLCLGLFLVSFYHNAGDIEVLSGKKEELIEQMEEAAEKHAWYDNRGYKSTFDQGGLLTNQSVYTYE